MAELIKTERLATEIIESLETVRDEYLSSSPAADFVVGEAQDSLDRLATEVGQFRGLLDQARLLSIQEPVNEEMVKLLSRFSPE